MFYLLFYVARQHFYFLWSGFYSEWAENLKIVKDACLSCQEKQIERLAAIVNEEYSRCLHRISSYLIHIILWNVNIDLVRYLGFGHTVLNNLLALVAVRRALHTFKVSVVWASSFTMLDVAKGVLWHVVWHWSQSIRGTAWCRWEWCSSFHRNIQSQIYRWKCPLFFNLI